MGADAPADTPLDDDFKETSVHFKKSTSRYGNHVFELKVLEPDKLQRFSSRPLLACSIGMKSMRKKSMRLSSRG